MSKGTEFQGSAADVTTGQRVGELPPRQRVEWLLHGRTLTERERLEERQAQIGETVMELSQELGSIRRRIAALTTAAAA